MWKSFGYLLALFGSASAATGLSIATVHFAEDVPTIPADTLPRTIPHDSSVLGFSDLPQSPVDNRLNGPKIELGRKLFFDPLLSDDGTVACASCHRPENGFADDRKVAIGIGGRRGVRNVPTVLNRGYGRSFSWDGRDNSLEAQVMGPLLNPDEMGNPNIESIVARLKADGDYVEAFQQAFGGETDSSISAEDLFAAIAAFQRVLVYGDTPVDRFRASEYSALTRAARQGMWIFESRGQCWKCHSGENFTDEDFHNTGVSFGQSNPDVGRFAVTGKESDRFRFKTPTLRGVELTAPYMHDGSQATLKDVVEFYNRGGAPDDPNLDPVLQPLNLSEAEVGYLVEFLKAMTK